MNPSLVSLLFVGALMASLVTKLWLATRQMRHVAGHRGDVPPAFADRVSLQAHQKAADYTMAKLRFGLLADTLSAAILLGWTLLGGLDALNVVVRDAIAPRWGGLAYELVLVGAFMLVGMLIDTPLDLWRTFRLEQRFGFNKMTPALYLADMAKSLVLSILVGGPLLAVVLWLMHAAGRAWWVWAWALLTAFQLLAMVLYPTLIAPLFNKFEPLQDDSLVTRVQGLMQRCGFRARGFFVMDGSRRSAHSNAYFTGFGAAKRVVFYDTLLTRLSGDEVEAVLAHELGHFRHRHIAKRLAAVFAFSLAGFALLGWLAHQVGFYAGLNVMVNALEPDDALALLLFLIAIPPFMFFVTPAFAAMSRHAEFEADAFARSNASAPDLVHALLKLYEDNANTLTPDPLFVRFYYSHPPASARIAALGVGA
ncbi:MAG TPA: M48 family metallopeptidase [Burkholderiaceae bacterium]|jgi:STE24 endopeptidase|nr:M48 family metallopeptidase [Burkholderiaceae bacterium]